MAQLLLGLVNGSFYAMLSLGLAIIFGLLNVINLSHGALYMMGAFAAWMGMNYLGLNYWIMLGLAPLVVAIFGIVIERTMLRRLYKLDHLYGLLLMIGLSQLLEGTFPLLLRRLRQVICGAGGALRLDRHWLHGTTKLPRLGGSGVGGCLLFDLVRYRTDASSAPISAPAPRTQSWSRPSASTCRAWSP